MYVYYKREPYFFSQSSLQKAVFNATWVPIRWLREQFVRGIFPACRPWSPRHVPRSSFGSTLNLLSLTLIRTNCRSVTRRLFFSVRTRGARRETRGTRSARRHNIIKVKARFFDWCGFDAEKWFQIAKYTRQLTRVAGSNFLDYILILLNPNTHRLVSYFVIRYVLEREFKVIFIYKNLYYI